MSDSSRNEFDRVAEMRRAFDEAFMVEPSLADEAQDRLLTLRICGDRFAVHMTQVGGIARCPRVEPLPSRVPALLGLTGLRGELTPIYALSLLLGYASPETPRWILLSRRTPTTGLAIEDFGGCIPVGKGAFVEIERPQGPWRMGSCVRVQETLHAMIDLEAVFQALTSEEA
ncbi:MAG: chemotaxis protein CheW [Planctomycetes bacterium]|nr:chemotaxis protein CheW [Planctomycetota bacterium]